MARRPGRNGQLYVGLTTSAAAPEPLLYTSKFTVNANTDRIECTAFGDSGSKTYVAGNFDGQIEFEGYYDSASDQTWTAALDGLPRYFYAYFDTPSTGGDYFFGSGYFDFQAEADVAGVIKMKGTMSPATPLKRS